jgi:hypothetical protein
LAYRAIEVDYPVHIKTRHLISVSAGEAMRLNDQPCWHVKLILVTVFLAWHSRPATSAADSDVARQWAVLIAVQEHEDASLNLRFTNNDVEQLRRVLVERAGMPGNQILELTTGASEPSD